MKDISIKELKNTATQMRMKVIDMIYKAQSGHPGGSLSAADFVTACYFKYMNIDPKDPRWPDRDRMVLSKGHVCPIQYACLASVGFFPESELDTLRKEGSMLQGHPSMNRCPGIDISTGSLGQGLACAVGMAMAGKMDHKDYKVFCVVGDGEAQEGEIWEAANTAHKYGLDNLIVFVDGDVAYTGGVNIADEYANLIERFGYWKDSGVCLEGEGAWGLTASFIRMCVNLGGVMHNEHDYYRPHTPVKSEGFCQPFTDGPQNNPDNPAEDVFLQMISGARRFLYITTPYFIPDESLMRALCIAGDGGVDVRLMLPGKPDHWYADCVAESYFGELIKHGVKVYRYIPGFLHGKSIMVDREAAFVGSANMDYRSFELDYECGVMVYSAPMIESLLEDMDMIVDRSHLVTAEEWAKRSVLRRVFEPLLRLFAIWM